MRVGPPRRHEPHLNVAAPDDDLAGDGPARDALEPFVYEFAAAARGSISAEHGVGQCKAHKLPLQRSDAALATMRALKNAAGDHAILNPGKVLPAVESRVGIELGPDRCFGT